MDIATGAALIIMGFTIVIGCIWFLRRTIREEQEEYYVSFEI